MMAGMRNQVEFYRVDPLSTPSGVHVFGTEEQADSDSLLWSQMRSLRITGTTFKDYSSNPKNMATKLWSEKRDLGHLRAIKWGRENEKNARKDYELKTGLGVTCVGMFISQACPIFAASPDGLVQVVDGSVLLEIKCPFSLKDKQLKLGEDNCIFLDKNLSLKRSHQYYYQVQLGMFVTGCRETHFVV